GWVRGLVAALLFIFFFGGFLWRHRRWRQEHECERRGAQHRGEDRFHRTLSPNNVPPNADPCGLTPQGRRRRSNRTAQSAAVLIVLSLFQQCQEQNGNIISQTKRRRQGGVGVELASSFPLGQCAVSVEEASSTAGSVVTEVSVGLALSSSHSIGSGLRTRARASTSSMRETGMMSRFFLMLSLISTRSLAFSSGISTGFMPPRQAAHS